jgi:hypothetical protein
MNLNIYTILDEIKFEEKSDEMYEFISKLELNQLDTNDVKFLFRQTLFSLIQTFYTALLTHEVKKDSLPQWYKNLSLLQLQLKAVKEDIPIYLKERRMENGKDLEIFNLKLESMELKLQRAIDELTKLLIN